MWRLRGEEKPLKRWSLRERGKQSVRLINSREDLG